MFGLRLSDVLHVFYMAPVPMKIEVILADNNRLLSDGDISWTRRIIENAITYKWVTVSNKGLSLASDVLEKEIDLVSERMKEDERYLKSLTQRLSAINQE